MQGWAEFAVAFAVFLVAHAVPTRPRIKAAAVANVGARGFALAYSILSIVLLVWVIGAAGRAPFVALWAFEPWHRTLALGVMLLVCLLLSYALSSVNPLSFGGRTGPFDPRNPGVAGVTRHPVLLALALWAGAHLVANGDLAHLILFGVLGGFAILGMPMIDRRKRRDMGESWFELARSTSTIPLAAAFSGRSRPPLIPRVMPALMGVLIWGVLIILHPLVIGPDLL